MLVLPSRQECWGLVINEAASFGMPIVSTWGSGAAVEFLAADYPQYLAEPGNAQGLLQCIRALLASDDKETYSRFLREKAKDYSIERSVQAHLTALQ
jgi:glycosyltransferase involved in cell wall biosynthesis